jgi:hypothetical protein
MVAVYRSRRDHRGGNWVRAVCLAVSMAGFDEVLLIGAVDKNFNLDQVIDVAVDQVEDFFHPGDMGIQ